MNREKAQNKIILPFRERFIFSLCTWDPLPDIPLLKWLDPFNPDEKKNERSGRIRSIRLIIFIFIASAPPLILSLLASRTLGGGFWDNHGYCKDLLHIYYQWILLPCLLLLILIGRRLLGDMINQVDAVFKVGMSLERRLENASRVLRAMEWISRLNRSRFIIWAMVFIIVNIFTYFSILNDGFINWLTSPATPDTIFYYARIGVEQPNLAGIFAMLWSGPISAISILIFTRLLIEFSLSSSYMAYKLDGRIMPAYPDKSGGLLVVGRTALVLSLPIMLIGFSQTVITFQEIYIWGKSINWSVIVNWILYIGICPLLFLLPLMPLRKIMNKAKRSSLLRLHEIYASLFSEDDKKLFHCEAAAASEKIQGHVAALDLIERVSTMSVWPFDKKSFARFIGVVITPVTPLIANEAPKILQSMIRYLTQ